VNQIRRFCAIFLIGVSAVAVFGGSGARAQSEPVLKIGVPVAATGADAREGALALVGYELWADSVNSRGGIAAGGTRYKVQLIHYNDNSNPELSAQLTERLIVRDRVDFLLGPYNSVVTFADAAVAERHQVPFIAAHGTARKIYDQGYKYVFGPTSPAEEYGVAILKAAIALTPRPQTVAILSADDIFSREVASAARDWSDRNGLKVVYFLTHPVGATDLTAAFTAIGTLHPDVLLGSGHLQESLLIMREAATRNMSLNFYGFTVGPTTPEFVRALGPAADYVFASSQWTPDVRYTGPVFGSAADYGRRFKQKYGFIPDYHAAEGSAGGLTLQLAIEKAGSVDRQKVRDALSQLDVMTFFGRIKFNPAGQNIYKPMVTIQLQHRAAVTVWPPDVASAKAVYPTPPWNARP
jgi:branched-chain amino acid transport system substrate-binding protein